MVEWVNCENGQNKEIQTLWVRFDLKLLFWLMVAFEWFNLHWGKQFGGGEAGKCAYGTTEDLGKSRFWIWKNENRYTTKSRWSVFGLSSKMNEEKVMRVW